MDRAARILSLLTMISVRAVSGEEGGRQVPLVAPPGFMVQCVAGPPLVERPLFAALDEHGALFVLDSGGLNSNDRGEKQPDVLRRLVDDDGDGVYDRSTVFADGFTFGTGLAWFDGALFVTSPPSLWKLADTDGDGVADQRRELVTGFAFNQSCTDDLHGACAGPDGRIYFLPGRFEHRIRVPGEPVLRAGVGPWLMRCRPDGRDVEFVSGAVGNPVEVAFLPAGDAFLQGTFWAKNSAPHGWRDALIHAVGGGEYSVRDRDYNDRIRTGDYLPALVPLTATAPSGMMAYQSDALGPEFTQNLFTSHFNSGKILRHALTRQGGTFAAETSDFITPAQGDVHLTDVLEAADGSLLVIDTGGWFRACCPASVLAKPEVTGGIYRVCRDTVPARADPCGSQIPWDQLSPEELCRQLGDSRWMARERAIRELGRRGSAGVAALRESLVSSTATLAQRQNAVWALCRMDDAAAREPVRLALTDALPDVRQAAAAAAGLHRDTAAREALIDLLRDDSAAVRREAALALGRLGGGESVGPLMEALARESSGLTATIDRFVEHAVLFALIEIGDSAAVRGWLSTGDFSQRRGALIALQQMPAGRLQPEDVVPLLTVPQADLQQTAADVLAQHPQWTAEVVELVRGWLHADPFDERRASTLAGMVRTLRDDPPMQQLIQRSLEEGDELKPVARRTLLLAVADSGWTEVPAALQQRLAAALDADAADVRQAALTAIGRLRMVEAVDRLHRLAGDVTTDERLRLAALHTMAELDAELTAAEFAWVLSFLQGADPGPTRLRAMEVMALARHDQSQLEQLLPAVNIAGPLELPLLLKAFERGSGVEIGRGLVQRLQAVEVELPLQIVNQTLAGYGPEVLAEAEPLLERLRQASVRRSERLQELSDSLTRLPGDPQRGRDLFYGRAQCHVCHTAAGRGGNVGPDLTRIGEIRSLPDLLEAIVFPSTSFARGYEPIVVQLRDGRVLTGLAGRESAREIVLRVVQDQRAVEVSIDRDEVEQLSLGQVSTMPQGLERALQPQELSDLVAFLTHLK